MKKTKNIDYKKLIELTQYNHSGGFDDFLTELMCTQSDKIRAEKFLEKRVDEMEEKVKIWLKNSNFQLPWYDIVKDLDEGDVNLVAKKVSKLYKKKILADASLDRERRKIFNRPVNGKKQQDNIKLAQEEAYIEAEKLRGNLFEKRNCNQTETEINEYIEDLAADIERGLFHHGVGEDKKRFDLNWFQEDLKMDIADWCREKARNFTEKYLIKYE